MKSYEVCVIERMEFPSGKMFVFKHCFVAFQFTPQGRKEIKRSMDLSADVEQGKSILENMIASLAEDGWEPMPIDTGTSAIRWFFKRTIEK